MTNFELHKILNSSSNDLKDAQSSILNMYIEKVKKQKAKERKLSELLTELKSENVSKEILATKEQLDIIKLDIIKYNTLKENMHKENIVAENEQEFEPKINEKVEKEKKMEEEINQYKELFNDSLFDEAFMLLDENVSKIENVIGRSKHIRDFLSFIFDADFFNEMLDKNMLLPTSISFVKNLKEREILKEASAKLNHFSFVDIDMVSGMFSSLVKAHELDKAQFLLPFVHNNVVNYPNTLKDIIVDKDMAALRFICENMKNVNYNNGAILRMAINMQPQALKMLIEEFNFDINEADNEYGDNLISLLIKNKNIKQFKFVVENYSNRINWGMKNQKKMKENTLFDMINNSGMEDDFYQVLLSDLTLKSTYVETIAQALVTNKKAVEKIVQTDVYDMLFAHPNFDDQSFNLGQIYLIYGFLSAINSAAVDKNEDLAKKYVKVLDSYLSNYPSPSVKDAAEYHIVGAAVFAASPGNTAKSKEAGYNASKAAIEAVSLIAKNFPQFINQPNPNGELPIMQIDKDSSLYTLLINNGAIPMEPEKPKTFANSLMKLISGKKEEPTVNQAQLERAQLAAKETVKQNTQATPLSELRRKIREDLQNMQPLVKDPLCDLSIKLKCENMFLSADKLLMMMEKHKIKNAYEEMNFLSENFATYVQKTLTYYIQVCSATVDLAHKQQQDEKLKNAKEECLRQIDLLMMQVNLFSDNIFRNVEMNAKTDLRVQGRFLDEKMRNSKAEFGADKLVDTVEGNKENNKIEGTKAVDVIQKPEAPKSSFNINHEDTVAFKNIALPKFSSTKDEAVQIMSEVEQEIGDTPKKIKLGKI
jgi:hypothetical protein